MQNGTLFVSQPNNNEQRDDWLPNSRRVRRKGPPHCS